MVEKPIFGKLFFGPKVFPYYETQMSQKHSFIIWQDGQKPHKFFFTVVHLNGPTEKKSILVSQI